MITKRQEQIENGIEVLNHAMDFLTNNCPPLPFDLADTLGSCFARAKNLKWNSNHVTVKVKIILDFSRDAR